MERRELWPGGPTYIGDPVGTDSLALADFAAGAAGERCVDLGCGSGILMLLLAWRRPELRLEGVELRPEAAAECAANLTANGLERRCRVWQGDYRDAPVPRESMDLAVANPPYFPAGAGKLSPDRSRALMRTETATLEELCAAAAGLLRPGGAFCLVHRTERMEEVLSALTSAGLEPKRLRRIVPAAGMPAKVFLCRAVRGGPTGLLNQPPLILRDGQGAETPEYRKICHWEA